MTAARTTQLAEQGSAPFGAWHKGTMPLCEDLRDEPCSRPWCNSERTGLGALARRLFSRAFPILKPSEAPCLQQEDCQGQHHEGKNAADNKHRPKHCVSIATSPSQCWKLGANQRGSLLSTSQRYSSQSETRCTISLRAYCRKDLSGKRG